MTPPPGRQPERTALAWSRTGLALVAVALLLTRLVDRTGAAVAVLGVVAGVGAVALVAGQGRRHRRRVRGWRAGLEPALTAAALLTAGVVVLAVAAVVLVLRTG